MHALTLAGDRWFLLAADDAQAAPTGDADVTDPGAELDDEALDEDLEDLDELAEDEEDDDDDEPMDAE